MARSTGKAYIVQIEIDTTEMREDKVPNCICSLNGLGVVVKCI